MFSKAMAVGLALAVAWSVMSGVPAHAATPDWNLGNTEASQISNLNAQATGVLRNDGLGKCMDDWQGSTANGATVDSYLCNNTASQSWTFTPRQDYYWDLGFYGTVTPAAAPSKCLSVTSTNGGKVKSVAMAGSVQMLWSESGEVFAKSGVALGGWVKESDFDPHAMTGGSDGTQLMIGADSDLYARNTVGADPWTYEAYDARKIATNGGVQMYTDGAGAVYARSGIGTTWTTEYASGAKAIAVGSDGTQMIIGSDGAVYGRTSIGASTGWTKELATGAKEIATNGGVQMLIGSDGTVYARTGIGTTWTKESGAATDPAFTDAIAAGPDGTQMYIGSDNYVYAKKGVALNGWTKEGGPVGGGSFATSIAAGTGGVQMMIASGGIVDARTAIGTTAWTAESDLTTETDNGRPVQLFDCHNWDSQHWLFQHDPTGSIRLYNPDSGKCVDTPSSSTTDGTALWIYTCNGSIAQRFAPPAAPAIPSGPITNTLMAKCAIPAATTATPAAGTAVVLYGCGVGYSTGPVLPWTLQPDGTLMAGGRCLGATGGEAGVANGVLLQLAVCGGTLDQQWVLGFDSTGRPRLVNPNSGKCLDDPQSATANGTQLDLYTCNNTNAQVWNAPHLGHTFVSPAAATPSTLPTAVGDNDRIAVMQAAERARENRAHLAMLLHAGGTNVRKTAAQTLAGTDTPLTGENWLNWIDDNWPQDPNGPLTQDVNAAAIADQSRVQREDGISSFLHYPLYDSPPDFAADVTNFMSKDSTFWLATDALFDDLPTAKAGQAARDRVTAVAATHAAADPGNAWVWNLYRDETLRGSADDARRWIQYDGYPTVAPQPGTTEFRVEVESIKTRWAEGDPTNPLDPDEVLIGAEETAWAEWQAELNTQAQPRADILAAEMQALDALRAGAETMHDGLDYAWTAHEILSAQDQKLHGDQVVWSGVDVSKAPHDLGLIKAKVAALASAAQNEAVIAQDAATKAVAARSTAYATATAAGLPQGRGLTYALQSAEVTQAAAAAAQATSNAMQTAVAATNATLADSATLLANASAQAHAARALYQRQAAQNNAAQAAALAVQAQNQATAAATAASKAAADKAKVVTVEATATAAKNRADAAAADAAKQRQIAADAKATAETQRQRAATATAAAQQQAAIAAAKEADASSQASRAADDDATAQQSATDAAAAESRAQTARDTLDQAMAKAAAADAKAAAAVGTDAAADAQAAADQAHADADAAATAAGRANHDALVAEGAASQARAAATVAHAAASKADADATKADSAAATTHASAITAHSLAADAIQQAATAAYDAAAARDSAAQAGQDAANAKAEAAAAKAEAAGALADSAVATGQAIATGQFAQAAAAQAATVAAPANAAIDMAAPYAATDSAAGLSVLTSEAAKSMAQQQADGAAAAATQAAALAAAALDAANRASGDAKLAAQAASDAAASASKAAASAAAATASAVKAAADAKYTQDSSARIDALDAAAQLDATNAHASALAANGDADAASAAADASETDATVARGAAEDARASADGAAEDADLAQGYADDAQEAAAAAQASAANAQAISNALDQVQKKDPQVGQIGSDYPAGIPDVRTKAVYTKDPVVTLGTCVGTGGCDADGTMHVEGYIIYVLVSCVHPSPSDPNTCINTGSGDQVNLDILAEVPFNEDLPLHIHLTQQQLLSQTLRNLPNVLFGEFIGCWDKVRGTGGSWLDCGLVLAEIAAPVALKYVAAAAKELRLAIAIGDVASLDAALAVLKQSAIDTTALMRLENAARLARAKKVLEALNSCFVPHSFAAGTGVLMADGSVRPIERVHAGDLVRNAAPGGGTEVHRVAQIHVTTTDTAFTDLTVVAGGHRSTIVGTQNHPYYDLTRQAFVKAADLRVGEILQSPDGVATVAAVSNHAGGMPTYDLTVDDLHTYFVASGGLAVLVHNENACVKGIQAAINMSGLNGKWILADQMKIEEQLGGNLPEGYPEIDSFDRENKIATSIKTIDWRYDTYKNFPRDYAAKGRYYVNKMVDFKKFGADRPGFEKIMPNQVDTFVLRIAYPADGIDAAHLAALQESVQYGADRGIVVQLYPIHG